MNDKTKGCLALLSLPLFIVGAMFTYAWAARTMWGWFAVPLGAPSASLVQAYGLCSLLWLLTAHHAREKSDEEGLWEKVLSLAAVSLGRPLFAVAIAWLVRWVAS